MGVATACSFMRFDWPWEGWWRRVSVGWVCWCGVAGVGVGVGLCAGAYVPVAYVQVCM